MIGRSIALLLNAALTMSLPSDDYNACYSAQKITDFKRSLHSTVRCVANPSKNGTTCETEAPPQCGEKALAEVLKLVNVDPNDRPKAYSRCQIETLRASTRFVSRRIEERLNGERRQLESRKAMDAIESCGRPAADETGPAFSFGGQCANLPASNSANLTLERIVNCVRPALEHIVASLIGMASIPPNVVVVVTDDQHPAAGDLAMKNLARIAERGVRFANAFATNPLCDPSRASLLTGNNPAKHGVLANTVLDKSGKIRHADHSPTIGSWFRDAGYQTGMIGKYAARYSATPSFVPAAAWDEWRVFTKASPNFFDYELNENGKIVHYGNSDQDYSTDVIAKHSRNFINKNADRPFLLYFAPFAPHSPSQPAPRHAGAFSGMKAWRPPSWGEKDLSKKPGWLRFFAKKLHKLPDHDGKVQDQLESLLTVDEVIAAMVSQLDTLGILDNTILVVTADHGLVWGEHRWVGKEVPYEESIRIPLSINYPVTIIGGQIRNEIVANIDVAPTLAALSGIQLGDDLDGRTLTDLIDDIAPALSKEEQIEWRSELVIRNNMKRLTVPRWSLLRTDRWKFVSYGYYKELYDLETDPYELDNKATNPDYAERKRSMAGRLKQLVAEQDGLDTIKKRRLRRRPRPRRIGDT